VCLGNICRSPMAEIIMHHLIKANPNSLIDWHIDSCGTSNEHQGHNPDDRTIRVCRARLGEKGLPSPVHKARQLRTQDLVDFNFVLAMDEWNLKGIHKVKAYAASSGINAQAHISLLTTFDPEGTLQVEDPYYGGINGFESIYLQIERSLKNFIAQIELTM